MILELIDCLTEGATKRNMDFLLTVGQAMSYLGHQWLTRDIDFMGHKQTRTERENFMQQPAELQILNGVRQSHLQKTLQTKKLFLGSLPDSLLA